LIVISAVSTVDATRELALADPDPQLHAVKGALRKRRLLESMNVAPIDLAPLVAGETDHARRHVLGDGLFLDFLAAAAPPPRHEWQLSTHLASPPLPSDDKTTGMCNLYSITLSQDAMRRLFATSRDLTGNLPPIPGVFPNSMAPVVRRSADGERELTMMRWGMPGPPQFGGAPITNIRNRSSPALARMAWAV
jgi:hypothetical protein